MKIVTPEAPRDTVRIQQNEEALSMEPGTYEMLQVTAMVTIMTSLL